MKNDVPVLGFLIGLLAPVLGLVIVCFAWVKDKDFSHFMKGLVHDHDLAFKVISLSLLMNIAPFMWLTSRRRDLTARGIFIATMLYGVFLILIKFVWQ